MAVTILSDINSIGPGKDPENDVVFRQRRDAAARQDPKDIFHEAEVKVEFGLAGDKKKLVPVRVKWADKARYAFACFTDNKWAFEESYELWAALAKDALQRFAAMRNAAVILGPRPEDHNRYNFMIEVREAIPNG